MKKTLFFLAIIVISASINGQNASQWRGQDRNGIYYEKELLKEWSKEGPEMLWSVEGIGDGYSSVSVTEKMVYITGMKDTLDILTAMDLNGKRKWQKKTGLAWNNSYPGTRITPTVENNRIYMISGQGEIVCLEAETGKEIWQVNAYKKFEGYCTMWGVSESPLIVDDKIIYTPGGLKTTMVALDKKTGETIWQTESLKDSTAYVSPILIKIKKKKIIATITANYFFGVNAKNGKILWKYKYSDLKWRQTHWYSPIINCNSPLYHDGQIFISKGYNHKAAMFSLDKKGSEINLMWTDTILDVHIGGMVLIDNHIYGANWFNNRDGNWCCLDWKTGESKFEKKWECKGSIISADNLMYCYEEKRGNIALVEPSTDDFKIISTFKIDKGKGPHWAHPVIRNGVLYVRHGDVLMAYNIKKK